MQTHLDRPPRRLALDPTRPIVAPRPQLAVRWAGRLMIGTGLLDVLAVVMPPSRGRLRLVTEAVPLVGVQTAGAVTAAVGLLLIYVGAGMRRRTREVWYVAVALTGASAALNVVRGLDLGAALLSAAVGAVLVGNRAEFVAASGPASRLRALGAALGFALAGFGLGLAVIAARSSRLVPGQSVRLWFVEVADGMVGVSGPLRFTSPGVAGAVDITTSVMGLLAVGTGLVLLLRPRSHRPARSVRDEADLRALLARTGDQDSLGYFSLRTDKSVIFSPSRKAAVGYRVVGGVSLAAGDPIGDSEAWPAAIREWLADSRLHGWIPAVLGCGEAAGRIYERHGLAAIELGDEAIVDVATFTVTGRAMRAVRQAVARVERAGYEVQVARVRDLTPAVRAAAARAADRLRDGSVERGFSMALSRVADAADPDCVLALAFDGGGVLRGLLQLVPWGADGLSLDLMRRDRDAENGLIEYLVVSVLRQAPQLGVRRVSLNFAVLRAVFERGDRLGAGPVLRAWRRVLLLASRFWQIESLYRANAKYAPQWVPRFLCFPALTDLPRVGLAALRAEAFIVPPWRSRRKSTVDEVAAESTWD